MSYNTPCVVLTARKPHRCTNCGESINVGETYHRWTTFEDAAFVSKMHPECNHALLKEAGYGEFEYTPYEGERPHGNEGA